MGMDKVARYGKGDIRMYKVVMRYIRSYKDVLGKCQPVDMTGERQLISICVVPN